MQKETVACTGLAGPTKWHNIVGNNQSRLKHYMQTLYDPLTRKKMLQIVYQSNIITHNNLYSKHRFTVSHNPEIITIAIATVVTRSQE